MLNVSIVSLTGTHTHTNHVVSRPVTSAFVIPELDGLGKLHTMSSFCLGPVNPIWLLAAAQLHYYLPTVLKRSQNKVAEGESEIKLFIAH